MDYGNVLKIIILFSGWILYLSYFKLEQKKQWANSSGASSGGDELSIPAAEKKAVVPYLLFIKEYTVSDVRAPSYIYSNDPTNNHRPAKPPTIEPIPAASPNEREVHQIITMAEKFFRQNNQQKGLDLLDHAHKIDPRNAEVLVLIGTAKVELNEVAEADRYLSRALQVNPSHELASHMRSKTKAIAIKEDEKRLSRIDSCKSSLLNQFRSITSGSSDLKLLKVLNEHYYQFIYHTIAIEGNTLTFQQVRDVLTTNKAPAGADVSELAEVIGMEAAIRLVNRTIEFPITEQHILNLHRRVLSVDPDNAGEYRQRPVYVGNFAPPDEKNVPRLMANFGEFLQSDKFKSLHPIRQAALAHHRLTFIHPFVDGNGRTARLLMNQILLASDFPYINIRTADRLEYYRVLDEASKGDILEFERFLMNRMQGTFDLYMSALDNTDNTDISEDYDRVQVDPFRSVIEL